MTMEELKIGFIGFGNMAQAIADGPPYAETIFFISLYSYPENQLSTAMETLTLLPVLGAIGPQQIILIIVLIIIFFGAKKIPELMRGAGRGIKEFKDAMNKDYSSEGKDDAAGNSGTEIEEK